MKSAVKAIWALNSTYFTSFPYDMPGVLTITAANASFRSASPVSIIVQVPPKVLLNFSPNHCVS